MNNKKVYLSLEDRNENEKNTNKLSYKKFVKMYIDNMVLCNNITQIDTELFENIEVGQVDENTEIFQYFICDFATWSIDSIKKYNKNNDIIIAYSNVLDCYVLLVDHLGTSWDYISTDIELVEV